MKRIFILSLFALFAANAVANDCQDNIQAIYSKLKATTERIAAIEGKTLIASRLELAELQSPVIAQVWPNGLMQYDYRLCNYPAAYQTGTIAHEFGHLLQFALYPRHTKLAHSGMLLTNERDIEHAANHFGAKILRESQIDSKDYLAILDEMCNNRSHYHCLAAQSWKAGLLW